MINKNCKHCGKDFYANRNNQNYCSDSCKRKSEYQRRKNLPVQNLTGFEQATRMPDPEPQLTNSIPQDWKTYELQKLTFELQSTKDLLSRERQEKEDYKKKKEALELEIRHKDKEHELQTKESDLGKSKGLSGVVEKVTGNPEMMDMLKGVVFSFLNPPQASQQVPQEQVQPSESSSDSNALEFANWIQEEMSEQEQKHFWNLVTVIADNPSKEELLKKLVGISLKINKQSHAESTEEE